MASRVLCAFGGIAISVLIARLSGPEALGHFAFAVSVVVVVAFLGRQGLDMCLVRGVASQLSLKEKKLVRPYFWHTLLVTTISATLITAALAVVIKMGFFSDLGVETMEPLYWSALPLSSLAIAAAYFKGTHRVATATALEINGISLITAGILWIFYINRCAILPYNIAIIFFLVSVFLSISSITWVFFDMKPKTKNAKPENQLDTADRRKLTSGQYYFMLSGLAAFITQAGSFIVIGPFISDNDLGLIRAAERVSLLVVFPMTAINPFITPRIVHYTSLNQKTALNTLMFKSCAISGLFALPITLVLFLFPAPFLSLFGDEFYDAALLLRILAIAQLITALFGPFAMLLYMSGREKIVSHILIYSLIACVILFPVFSIAYGATGFVIAYTLVNSGKSVAFIWISLRQSRA